MDYKDLQDKSIFDFCKDNNILQKILGFDISDKEQTNLYIKHAHPLNKISDIADYAYEIADNTLLQAAISYKGHLQSKIDDDMEKGLQNGIIID